MRQYLQALSPKAEFWIVVIGAFGYFILVSLLTAFRVISPGAMSEADYHYLLVLELMVLTVLLPFLRIRGWTLARIGLWPSARETLLGLGLALAFYVSLVAVLLLATSTSLLVVPETPAGPRIGLATILATSIVNPVFEEIFVCGYVMTAVQERSGPFTAINASVAVRLLYHLYQGAVGVIAIVPFGLIAAHWYVRSGRLWPVIVAHGVFDFFALLASSSGA